jgi:putative N-acetylmannosamine-6-phosphate epimerase
LRLFVSAKETQFGNTSDTVGMNHTDREQPRDVVAKVVHKSTDTISKINQIFESDCVDIQEKVNAQPLPLNWNGILPKKRR